MIDRPPPKSSDRCRLRLATLNLWGRFADWPRRLDVIGRCWPAIDADILCIQESCRDDAGDQAAELAAAIGLDHHQVAFASGRSEGPGIVSRFPLVNAHDMTLTESAPPRSMLTADVMIDAKRISVISAHTAFDPANVVRRHLRQVLGADMSEALLIGADLNATPSKVFPLLDRYGLEDALNRSTDPSWPVDPELFRAAWMAEVGRRPNYRILRRRLDYILARGLDPRGAGMTTLCLDDTHASDHALLWADYELP